MYTEITTIEEAFKRQKDQLDLSKLPDLSSLPDKFNRGMNALLKLQVITEAVNNDNPNEPEFEADYNDSDQEKWFPWYRGGDSSDSGFRFVYSYGGWSTTSADGGARLALKDEARADHMNKYFGDFYKELWLILK
jgi:hypothetical protein